MPLRNGEFGYGLVTKVLHWATVAVITGQFVVGYQMEAPDTDKKACKATEESDAAEAQEERCEEALETAEDEYVADAWSRLWSGDGFGDGLSLPELHVVLGLTIIGLGVLRVLWRATTPLPPWAEALSAGERRLEALLEKAMLLLLFVVPGTGLLLIANSTDWLPVHVAAHIAFYVTIGLHVLLVLQHTVIRRDRHLARML